MRVFLFIEHYPNPYKPWIDTQIVQMLKDGHDLRIFAFGAYTSTLHDEVREYRLLERTGYLPSTLRALRTHGGRAAGRLLQRPLALGRRAVVAGSGPGLLKRRLLNTARAVCLPDDPPDVCYIHNLVAASMLTFLPSIYPRARVCLYFHGGEVGGQPKVSGESAVFAAADAVITSTRFAGAQAVERGCDPGKIAVVPLGFHLPGYAPSVPRRYRPDNRVRFVSVGRMSPEKGFRHALEAVRLLRDQGLHAFQYTLVGAGIELEDLQAFVREHRLEEQVRFAGERTRAEVAAILDGSDVFILPSISTPLWAETQATVVQEALLMGCLTITTQAGGVPESNAPEMARYSVPPADAQAIAARMRDIMELDSAEMALLGGSGRAFATRKYDIAPLMRRILAHAAGELPGDDPARFVQPSHL